MLYDRIRRAISEPRPVVWAFDQDLWATNLDYAEMPLKVSRQIFNAVRYGVIYQAQLHYVATLFETDSLESPLLPGFSVTVASLFDRIPRSE